MGVKVRKFLSVRVSRECGWMMGSCRIEVSSEGIQESLTY